MPNLTDLATVRTAIPRIARVPDAEINRLIGECSDTIETYCARQFGAATFTEVLDAGVSGSIFVRNPPITAVTSITIGLPLAPVVLNPSTYRFNPITGEIRGVRASYLFPWDLALFNLYDSFGYGWQSVQIVYQGAFAAIPPKVVGLCISLINRSAANLANDPGTQSKTFGNVSYTSTTPLAIPTLTDADKNILSLYRNWGL